MSNYILNTTFIVDNNAQTRWLDFISKQFIPYLRDQKFTEITFTRVISVESSADFTYSLQIGIADMEAYSFLTQEIMSHYNEIAQPLFENHVVYFHTLLKILEM